jgi:hypothetical protein
LCRCFVQLIHAQIPGNGPLGSADALSGLIEFGSHIEVADLGFSAIDGIEDNEGVDLEICKVQIDVNTVETDEEVNESLLLLGRDVGKKGRSDGLAGGEGFVDGDIEDKCFSVDIANINTTFVSKENRISFALGVDTDVVFSVRRMGLEWFDNKVVKCACYGFDL